MQDRQQRALIYNQCAPPHPDPSSHRTARPSITFPRRAARNPKPPRAAQPESRTQDLLAPRNQNPEPKTSSRRATRTQTVPDSSRSAAACRYSCPRGIRHTRRALVAVFSHALRGLVVFAVSITPGVLSSRSSPSGKKNSYPRSCYVWCVWCVDRRSGCQIPWLGLHRVFQSW